MALGSPKGWFARKKPRKSTIKNFQSGSILGFSCWPPTDILVDRVLASLPPSQTLAGAVSRQDVDGFFAFSPCLGVLARSFLKMLYMDLGVVFSGMTLMFFKVGKCPSSFYGGVMIGPTQRVWKAMSTAFAFDSES